MKKIKQLCKIKKEFYNSYEKEIKELLQKPNYFCKKCLRACKKSEFLCKPQEL